MEKDIQELTQNERYDLKRKQIKEEWNKIEEFTLQQVIDNQERVIKEQKEDIERLQAQLDREIHINRIMKKALEEYANRSNWSEGSFMTADEGIVKADEELAQQTLKQIEEME